MNSQGIQRQNIQPQMNKKINFSWWKSAIISSLPLLPLYTEGYKLFTSKDIPLKVIFLNLGLVYIYT